MASDTDYPGRRSLEETFAILGHETRLAILYELWVAVDQTDFGYTALSFGELRKRVGMRDGSQFNYHLKKLVGPFVRRTDDGYELRRTGKEIIHTMLAGTLTEKIVLDAVPIDDPCPLCGGQVVLDHETEQSPDYFISRCTNCDGLVKHPELPSGMLTRVALLRPAGARGRSLPEMYRAGHTAVKHQLMSMIEGVCPQCDGTVTATPRICEDHVVGDGHVCPQCNTLFEIRFDHICNICKESWLSVPVGRHILMHPTVAAFYHDHGYDGAEAWGHNWLRLETETIVDLSVVTEDPLEIDVLVVVDDDWLSVRLDGDGTVVDVQS